MKRSLRITAVTIILLLVVALGLNIVFASGAEPGSSQDPIISKSYVDAAVSQLTAGMQKLQEQVDALKNENTQLTAKLAAQEQSNKLLQDQVNALKTGIATGVVKNSGSTVGTGTNPPASIGKATVNTAVLNIRKQANTTSAIVAKVAMGETLTLVSKSGDWHKVTTSKGITGYVMTKLILIKK
jgi:X-X-X-Leu-X-X-Gly heptad repeat protein